MASDRGTLPRGVDQQAPWAGPTAPAGRRLPSAPRERKPALAVLAVLLIVGGALAAGLLVVRSGQRVGAVEITQAVAQGEQIPAGAIQEVEIAKDSGVNYVSWQYASQVPQYFATMPIPKGTLLNNGMLAKTNALPNGDAEVGLALKDGQVPIDLQAGDTISIYSTQITSGNSGCPGKPGSTLAADATVISAAPSSAGADTTDVVIAMDPLAVGPVVCNTANGTAGIAITPGTGGG
jgi:hypothetical protein